MNNFIDLLTLASSQNYEEAGYLAANPDVAAAVEGGSFPWGLEHFKRHGEQEGRSLIQFHKIEQLRKTKMERLAPFLRQDMRHSWIGDKVDYLTDELREETKIISTTAVSSNEYDGNVLSLLTAFPDGLILDCGAGSRSVYHENSVNFEIANYPSTDVLGVGEELPFKDNTFDAVISSAVLEHVRNPFRCADEISRVLKPGGRPYCSVPFLQPYHGYPHHYFNATAQGIQRLFEEKLIIEKVSVLDSMHPVWTLNWIINSWSAGLSDETRATFEAMTVGQMLKAPLTMLSEPFCSELSEDKKFELACATLLEAHKPLEWTRQPRA